MKFWPMALILLTLMACSKGNKGVAESSSAPSNNSGLPGTEFFTLDQRQLIESYLRGPSYNYNPQSTKASEYKLECYNGEKKICILSFYVKANRLRYRRSFNNFMKELGESQRRRFKLERGRAGKWLTLDIKKSTRSDNQYNPDFEVSCTFPSFEKFEDYYRPQRNELNLDFRRQVDACINHFNRVSSIRSR